MPGAPRSLPFVAGIAGFVQGLTSVAGAGKCCWQLELTGTSSSTEEGGPGSRDTGNGGKTAAKLFVGQSMTLK